MLEGGYVAQTSVTFYLFRRFEGRFCVPQMCHQLLPVRRLTAPLERREGTMSRARAPRPQTRNQSGWFFALALIVAAACGANGAPRASDGTTRTIPPSDARAPVGLAI